MANQADPISQFTSPAGVLVTKMQGIFPYISATILFLWLFVQLLPSRNRLQLVNKKKWYELSWNRTINDFTYRTKEVLQKAMDASEDKPFQLYTNQGLLTVLPPRYINEIKKDPRLDLTSHIHRVFFGNFPGFQAVNENSLHLLAEITQKSITTNLVRFTKPSAEECSVTLKAYFTDDPNWHQIEPQDAVSQVVSRMATRVFLGKDFCEDPHWIDASTRYAITLFFAAERFSLVHAYVRPMMHWFIHNCQKLRRSRAECATILDKILKRREVRKSAVTDEYHEHQNDTIAWAEMAAKGKSYNLVDLLLSMGLGAISTTTNMMTWFLLCIANNPETIEPLREEIIGALREGGWKKATLYNLKLLDSAMKESQRLKPLTLATMRRRVMEDMTLSDGTFLPEGTLLVVASSQLRDPKIYPNPDKFDIYRFYNMRQLPGKENVGQFVTTSPDHVGFGHGPHACPGRFFASNQIKVALCHILLKYDIRVSKGSPTDSMAFGLSLVANPRARLDIRRRKEELDLEMLD